MKKLADYRNEEAIVLWGELLTPISTILADKKIRKAWGSKMSRMEFIGVILKEHPKEVTEILTCIDPTPVDALNIVLRVADVVSELENSDFAKDFFGSAGQAATANASTGKRTGNIAVVGA